MGKTFDVLLKRSFKTNKFKGNVNVAISRLSVLKNQRQIRCSIARSDVLQLLNLGQHERALLRVEVVTKEQNMLDAFVMMEGYCDLLIQRLHLIEQEKTCPDELKEAASSLIYASSRCGEFPELQEIRAMLGSKFGKDFVARAVELRNNCGVNTKIIQKLSTRMPSLENRIKVLKDIALENNIVLQLEEVTLEKSEDKVKETPQNLNPNPNPNSYSSTKYEESKMEIFLQAATELKTVEGVTDKKQYKNVADAAQAAFESAAYAAAAARAAVELSRADSHDHDHDHDPDNLSPISRNLESKEPSIHPVQNDVSQSDKQQEETAKTTVEKFKKERNESKSLMRSLSNSSSESYIKITSEIEVVSDEDLLKKLVEKEINFDESDDETMYTRTQGLGLNSKQTIPENHVLDNEDSSESIDTRPYSSAHKFFLFGSRDGSKFRVPKEELVNKDKVPISVRTKRTFRWGQ